MNPGAYNNRCKRPDSLGISLRKRALFWSEYWLEKFFEKSLSFFEKTLDKKKMMWYNKRVVERWLSWSKAHDWKSCIR